MDIEFIYEGFDYYIKTIHTNKQIEKYIKHIRTINGGEDLYDNFDYIFEQVDAFGKSKLKSNGKR